MPGFIETTIHQGYGYLEQTGYVDKARPYVEKARNTVPLVDRAAKKAEEIVPPLIVRADELAEPTIEKIKPYVGPRIEQVKETVTPYVNKGVETYEHIKDFTDAKTTQIKDFTDRRTSSIKEFTDAKATQIKQFTDPKVTKIKGAVEPHLVARKIQAQKLLRVAGCTNLQDLKYETMLGKVASSLAKVEVLLDKYLPASIERRDSDSDSSTESDSSYTKINKSIHGIRDRLVGAFMIKVTFVLSLPTLLKTAYSDGTLKEKVVSRYTDMKGAVISNVQYLKEQANACSATLKDPKVLVLKIRNKAKSKGESLLQTASVHQKALLQKLAPTVSKVAQNSHFKKAVQASIAGSEKILGKEKTVGIVQKIEFYIPAVWKVASKSETAPSIHAQTTSPKVATFNSVEPVRKRK